MTESPVGSHEYNQQLAKLQDALLRGALSQDQYAQLKADFIHPSSVIVDPVYRYNLAVIRLQRALLRRRIDHPTYDKLLADLIRPDGVSRTSSTPVAPSMAAAPLVAAAPPAAAPPPPSPPPPSPPMPSPGPRPEAASRTGNPRATLKPATIEDLIERRHEQGVLELIASHPNIADSAHLLERKIRELERKGDYSPIDLKTIEVFEQILLRLK